MTNEATTEMVNIEDYFKKLNEQENQEQAPLEKTKEEIVEEFFPQEKAEEEEVKAPKAEIPAPKIEEENIPSTNVYNKVVDYINNGFLENTEIEIGEGEDMKKVFLSDLKDIDEDTLKYIISEQKKAKEEEIKEKYISTDGLDARTKKMIELKKAGGDLTELIQEEVTYTNALAGLNLDDEAVQEGLVRQQLNSKGLHPKVVNAQIEAMKEDMTLDLEAKKIVEDYNAYYDNLVETKKQEQLASLDKYKEEQKEFRKNINQSLRDINLPESLSKAILDNTTKTDEYGLTNTDKLYFDSKKDPKLHAEVSFFLNNREEFQKFVELKTKNKATIEQVNKVIRINPKNIKTEVQAPLTDEAKKEEQLKEFFKQ